MNPSPSAAGPETVELHLTSAELELRFSLGRGVARVWRQRRCGPPWVKLHKCVRYPLSGIKSWIADQQAIASQSAGV